jgi:hypothetical protein
MVLLSHTPYDGRWLTEERAQVHDASQHLSRPDYLRVMVRDSTMYRHRKHHRCQ